jgi:hypothetical protein
MSVGELVDPDDSDETESERLRELIVIGVDRFRPQLSLALGVISF